MYDNFYDKLKLAFALSVLWCRRQTFMFVYTTLMIMLVIIHYFGNFSNNILIYVNSKPTLPKFIRNLEDTDIDTPHVGF